jgi:hypothetical protein
MARIVDRCPPWLLGEISKLLGNQLLRGLSTNRDDELRRVREALDWLDTKIPISPDVR